MTGTVEILLKGEPSTTRVLYARYTSVWRVRSTMRTTRVSLKMSEVFTLNISASLGSFVRSTVIGPTWRHAMAKRERSSATPTVPFIPPVRACERGHVAPGAWESSKALTQILSLAPRTRNVVETQPMSSACSHPTAPPRSTTQSIQHPRYRSFGVAEKLLNLLQQPLLASRHAASLPPFSWKVRTSDPHPPMRVRCCRYNCQQYTS